MRKEHCWLLLTALCLPPQLAAQDYYSPIVRDSRPVTFRVEAPKARVVEVQIDGERIALREKADRWEGESHPLPPGIHDYVFAPNNATTRGAMGGVILVWAVITAQLFGSRSRATAWFDRLLRVLVWGIVACFGLVAIRAGIEHPGEILRGFLAFRVPESRGDVSGIALVISGLATSVGVNMVFLYPYTLLARG